MYFWDIPHVFDLYPTCISPYPWYPTVSLYLSRYASSHVAADLTVSRCTQLFPYVSSCIQLYLLYILLYQIIMPGVGARRGLCSICPVLAPLATLYYCVPPNANATEIGVGARVVCVCALSPFICAVRDESTGSGQGMVSPRHPSHNNTLGALGLWRLALCCRSLSPRITHNNDNNNNGTWCHMAHI